MKAEKNELKPMLHINEMVDYLKLKNIKFERISEKDAENYLKNNNNYYNLTSYKNNFEKYFVNGIFIDKYIDLDFSYLKDLSIIDHRLRLILFKMIIDIEHYLKIKILNTIESIDEEDGYRIVNRYLEQDFYNVKLRNAVAHNNCILSELNMKKNKYPPSYKIIQFLNNCNIGKDTRSKKLSNSRIRQITYTLYMFNEIVTSDGIKNNVKKDINELFFDRIIKHKEYYNNNELLKSIYCYLKKIIENNYMI